MCATRRPRLAAAASAGASAHAERDDDQSSRSQAPERKRKRWPDALPVPPRLPLARYAAALAARLSPRDATRPPTKRREPPLPENDARDDDHDEHPRALLVATGNVAASKAVGILVEAVQRGERELGYSALVAVAVVRGDGWRGGAAAAIEAARAGAAAAAAAAALGSLAVEAEPAAPAVAEAEAAEVAAAAPAAAQAGEAGEAGPEERVPSRDDVFCFYTWSVPHAVGEKGGEEEQEGREAAAAGREDGGGAHDGGGGGHSSSSPVLVASSRSPPIALARRIDAEVSRAGFAVVEAAMGPAAVVAVRAIALASVRQRRTAGGGGGGAGGGIGGGGGDSGGGALADAMVGGSLGFHAGLFRAPDVWAAKARGGRINPPRPLRLVRLTVVPVPEEWWWERDVKPS